MILYDLISCHPLINDSTDIGLIVYDPERSQAIAQLSGNWFEDRILKYMNYNVEQFMYWAVANRLLARITQEGENHQ